MAVAFGAAGLETEAIAGQTQPWPEIKGRGVIRHYPTAQQMLDDRGDAVRAALDSPWTWFDRLVVYAMAYRNNAH